MEKTFTKTILISLIILFAIGLNSCKKDFITTPLEETTKSKIVSNGISLETVNFRTFKKEVDFNKLGKLKTTFESVGNEKSLIKLEGTQNDDFVILLDSVKKLVRNGKTSYVFALKQNTPRAISFRNLTIEQNATKDSLKVFITVYTPDKKWIDEFKKSGRANWSGKVSFSPINLAAIEIPKLESTNNKQVESDKKVDLQQVCSTITVAVPVYSRCPDEEQTIPIAVKICLTGINIITHTECWMIEPPGGGGYGGGSTGGDNGGGSNTTPNPPGGYNPCDGEPGPIGVESFNGMQLFVVPPTPCDPTAPGDPYPIPPSNPLTAKEFLIQILQITNSDIIAKLGQTINTNTTVTIADVLTNYCHNNGGFNAENINFLNWAANYLTNSNVDFEDFKNEYLINQPNINNVILLSLIDTTGLSAYPKFKEIITNLPGFLNTYPNVKKALAFYTGFTEAEVMSKMQPGKGPKIILSSNFPSTKYGHYNALNKTLELNINYINGLEAAQSSKTIQATALLLAITTFHEFVHYGRNFNKLTYDFINPNNGVSTEAGWTFEQNIDPAGLGINKYRAIKWLEFYNFNF